MAGHSSEVSIDLVKTNDTSLPDSFHTRLKAKPDGKLYHVDSAGEEFQVTNEPPVIVTQLNLNGGDSGTTFSEYLIRLDFGANGSKINPTGTP